jgi:AraC-like DNA-binding protein
MDALSDVMRTMRLKGGVFLHGEYRAPWCLAVQPDARSCAPYLGDTAHIIPYHYVLQGRARFRMKDGDEFELGPGETVMFPRNDPHLMGSDLSRRPVPGDAVVEAPGSGGGLLTIRLGESGATTRIVCGFLGAEDIQGNPIIGALPATLRLAARTGSAGDWIRSCFHHAAEQIAAGRTASEVMMSKLSELLFVEAVQRYAEDPGRRHTGWLAAFADRQLSRALALLHARVAEDWTVDSLGREVGLSRSALAARFVEILGMPPMQYLASWRIHSAAHELVNTGKPIPRIAQDVGYESEASFTRAFKRVMGAPPAAWRRQRLAG